MIDKELHKKYSYLPGNRSLEEHTIPMESYYVTTFLNDTSISNELNLHSLRCIIQSKITYEYLSNYIKKRPFLISRSTYPGYGKYGGHWLGENYSTWKDLKFSIPALFNFHMFGIPFVGSNIWGYRGDATSELWVRWHQLGIFMPFSRNHNAKTSISQEPYSLGSQLKTFATKAIRMKYSFILYHYNLLSIANKDGGAYITPMWYYFPPSTNSTIDIFSLQEQMMFGPAMLAAPVLDHYEGRKKIYFPDEDFYDFITGTKVIEKDAEVFIDVDIESVPIYIRAGYIVPCLQFSSQVQNTVDLRNHSKIDLHIALKKSNTSNGVAYYSEGMFIVDDGETIDAYRLLKILKLKIKAFGYEGNYLTIEIETSIQNGHSLITGFEYFGSIYLYGYSIVDENSRKVKISAKRYNQENTDQSFTNLVLVKDRIQISDINIAV